MLKLLHDGFILKGEYPLGKDTSLVKMYAAGGNLQLQLDLGHGRCRRLPQLRGGGVRGRRRHWCTTLQARQTAYKDKRLDSTPDLFEALEIKLNSLV